MQPLSEERPPPSTQRNNDHAEARRLIARCARGEQDALSTLYSRFGGLLLAIAMRVVRDHSIAEDIVQEAFLYAWEHASRYDSSRSSPQTWLTLIARSRAIDRLRKTQYQTRLKSRVKAEDRSPVEAPVAAGSVLTGERRHRIRAAFTALPPEQGRVIDLAYYGGLTQKEISEQEGVPLGTIKTRTLLAMRKMRRSLEPEIAQLI